MCEICQNWARDGRDSLKIGGNLLLPNHHPNCPHYNDSLVDVWKVTLDSVTCYVDNETDATETAGQDEPKPAIVKEKMHREVFDNLPEFDGF
jgi:hypothetical protein